MLIEENAKKSNEKLKKLQNQLKINENTQSLQLENSIYIEKVAALMIRSLPGLLVNCFL